MDTPVPPVMSAVVPADAFAAVDSDGDDLLTPAEAGSSLNAVVRLFAESAFQSGADENDSGDISEEEFLAAAPAGASAVCAVRESLLFLCAKLWDSIRDEFLQRGRKNI